MPFSRPSLTDLREVAFRDLKARFPGTPILRRSNLGVIADVFAGLMHMLYGFQAWIVRQVFPDTAETEFLERWGAMFGIVRKGAARASGSVTLTGLDGSLIPAGTRAQRPDGQVLTLAGSAEVANGAVTVAVQADVAGQVGNAEAGDTYRLMSALAGVDADATVVALNGGADAEDDASLRTRLMQRIQQPPHGGAAHDYVAWALEVENITRAWAYGMEMGAGTVTVRVMADDIYENGIPLAADVAMVQEHINLVRPITAHVYVVAPIPKPINVVVSGLTPNTTEIQSAAMAEIADTIRRRAEPGKAIKRSWIWEAVSLAAGEDSHEIATPDADVEMAIGHIAVPGAVTFE